MPRRKSAADVTHGVPMVAVSTTSTRVNKTGSWKYIRPVFRDKVAPCNQGCPVGIDIEAYMNLLREGRSAEAVDVLLRENPLPATTGRICYHRCETACNRARLDGAVSIHAVERMLGDRALTLPLPQRIERTQPETVGVIGSGPAGLACAYHLARMGYGVVIYESAPEPGGVLRYGIPEYRLPKAILAGEVERIRALGVEIRCGVRIGSELDLPALDRHQALFVAVGAHKSRALGIDGEDLEGVHPGLAFLEDVNRGRDPRLGARVVVVGGGNTAMDCARSAIRLGAEVLVLYRRRREDMPANPEEVEAAICEGVRFQFQAAPVAVQAGAPREDGSLDGVEASFGESAGEPLPARVRGLTCVRMTQGKADASGRPRPVPIPGSEFALPADTVLTALGEDAETDVAPDLFDAKSGAIVVSPLGRTRRAPVFAGGDATDTSHTVADALGSGKRAAIGIDHFLRECAGEAADGVDLAALRLGPHGNVSVTRWRGQDPVRRADPVNEVVSFEELNPAHFGHTSRHHDRFSPPDVTRRTFREANHGLTDADARAEANRCLNCGVCNGCEVCLVFCPDVAISRRPEGGFEIAYDYCKGCGVCAEECPRGAITMTREGL